MDMDRMYQIASAVYHELCEEEEVFDGRNRDWVAAVVADAPSSGHALLVVGAAHLVDPKKKKGISMLRLLEADGYHITPIKL